MPRIRTIKPEFWRSPDTARASAVARLLYIAMWNWADDEGRGECDLKSLEGFAFPNDDVAELSGGTSDNFRCVVAEVSECFGVVLYIVRGRPYYAIPSWSKHQRNERLAKGKYPGPEEGVTCTVDEIGGSCRKFRRVPTEIPRSSGPGTGEQGNRGTGEQGKKEDVPAAPKRRAAAPDAAAPQSPEQIATAGAYERVGKAFKFVAVLQIAKWAIRDRDADPLTVEDAIVAIYELGKPITRQVLGQYLDGHLCNGRDPTAGNSHDEKVAGYLAYAAAATPQPPPDRKEFP